MKVTALVQILTERLYYCTTEDFGNRIYIDKEPFGGKSFQIIEIVESIFITMWIIA